MTLFSGIFFFHTPYRGLRVDHLLLWYLLFLRWLGEHQLRGTFGQLAQVTFIMFVVVAGKTDPETRLGQLAQVSVDLSWRLGNPVPRHVWPISSCTPSTLVSPNHQW